MVWVAKTNHYRLWKMLRTIAIKDHRHLWEVFGPKMLYIAITGLTVNLSYVKYDICHMSRHLENVSIYTISYNPANDSKR